MRSASSAVQQSLYHLWADQELHNQSARVRAAAIRADGSLVLPNIGGPLVFETTEQVAQRDIALSPIHPGKFKADLLTRRRALGETGTGAQGEVLWEYLLSIRYAQPLPDGTSREVTKTRAVWKSAGR